MFFACAREPGGDHKFAYLSGPLQPKATSARTWGTTLFCMFAPCDLTLWGRGRRALWGGKDARVTAARAMREGTVRACVRARVGVSVSV